MRDAPGGARDDSACREPGPPTARHFGQAWLYASAALCSCAQIATPMASCLARSASPRKMNSLAWPMIADARASFRHEAEIAVGGQRARLSGEHDGQREVGTHHRDYARSGCKPRAKLPRLTYSRGRAIAAGGRGRGLRPGMGPGLRPCGEGRHEWLIPGTHS